MTVIEPFNVYNFNMYTFRIPETANLEFVVSTWLAKYDYNLIGYMSKVTSETSNLSITDIQ
ncbi:hypothetical protein D3C71_1763500 [compost metagenome]